MQHRSLIHVLAERFADAIADLTGTTPGQTDPQIRAAQDARFGDYQCNAALSLARSLQSKPREIAERIVAAVDLADLAEPPEIAGPGFINIRLKREFLEWYLFEIPAPPRPGGGPDRLGLPPVDAPLRVVVDYSSPNIAKQMHVGHLRSTVIGDALVRVLDFQGHDVIRQNHVGDWGTQFGMLIEHYAGRRLPAAEDPDAVLSAIEDDYRAANERFNSDPAFAAAARLAVGRLQAGEARAREVWQQVCAASRAAFLDLYHRLGVLLQDSDVCGESFYNDRLADVVAELRTRLAPPAEGQRPNGPWAELRDDRGAVCLFFFGADAQPLFRNPQGEPLPMIVQKSDRAYLYATTDLAAIRYRIRELGARRVLYVVGAPTKLHLDMLFTTARLAGWAGDDVSLEHVSFGQVLGEDRKLLRTRSGGAVKLRDLLDEAERRAYDLLQEREPQTPEPEDPAPTEIVLDDAQKREIARRVGVAAVKYFDLNRDRKSDYVFNWDQMLALQGNTGPYMLYAYVRILSIYRKAEQRFGSPNIYADAVELRLQDPTERALGLRLAGVGDAVEAAAASLSPHVLCAYLYDLAVDFNRFYLACSVIHAPDPATRLSRMRLCDLTARTLKLGLWLLGIEVLERM